YEDIAVYADLANRGELTVRVYAVPGEDGWYDQAKLGLHRAFGSPWLRIGAVRAVIDPATRTLDVLDDIARANGGRDRRFRLDGSRLAAADLDRLASLNAVTLLRP